MQVEKFKYDNKIVKLFAYATVFWGVIGMLVGLLVAFQFIFPSLSFNLEYTTFGRVRPLHTNAVIFAFVGNGIFAGVYYSLQRLLKARMYSDLNPKYIALYSKHPPTIAPMILEDNATITDGLFFNS